MQYSVFSSGRTIGKFSVEKAHLFEVLYFISLPLPCIRLFLLHSPKSYVIFCFSVHSCWVLISFA